MASVTHENEVRAVITNSGRRPDAKDQLDFSLCGVRSGPFMGFEGVIVRRGRETGLFVAVNFLQQGASVLLDDCQVERTD